MFTPTVRLVIVALHPSRRPRLPGRRAGRYEPGLAGGVQPAAGSAPGEDGPGAAPPVTEGPLGVVDVGSVVVGVVDVGVAEVVLPGVAGPDVVAVESLVGAQLGPLLVDLETVLVPP